MTDRKMTKEEAKHSVEDMGRFVEFIEKEYPEECSWLKHKRGRIE